MDPIFSEAFDNAAKLEEKVTSDPEIRRLDQEIELYENRMAEQHIDELDREHHRLSEEIQILNDLLIALKTHEQHIDSRSLYRILGEPGIYIDVSGTLLEVCTRWTASKVLESMPLYQEVLLPQPQEYEREGKVCTIHCNEEKIEVLSSQILVKDSLGAHVKKTENGKVVLMIVMPKIIGEAGRYVYSETHLSAATLTFSSVGKIYSRLCQAVVQRNSIIKSQRYVIYSECVLSLLELKRQRQIKANELRKKFRKAY